MPARFTGLADLPGSTGMRYSTGVAVTWISPVGPLKFSYGIADQQAAGGQIAEIPVYFGSVF